MDYGLLMIWGQAMAGAAGGQSRGTMRQTKPIPAEEASALMMDDGLLMILSKAMAVAGGGRSLPQVRQTNPIYRVFGLKMRVGEKTKPIQPGPFGPGKPEIRSPKPETTPKPPMLQTARARRVDEMRNKANPGR
jgi:hypothetical protein